MGVVLMVAASNPLAWERHINGMTRINPHHPGFPQRTHKL
jgi:hypothetical protein